jgi:hypothetical protein
MDERALELAVKELATTRHVLSTLIVWMAQSAASPISRIEASDLLGMLSVSESATKGQL